VPGPDAPAPRRRAARSDGLRNRRQVLEAATDAFSTVGLTASVNDIARNASVGVGTLYRHFPTKERLLAAVLELHLRELLEASREITGREGGEPGELLVDWMRALSAHISRFTPVSEWVHGALRDDPELRPLHEQVLAEGDALLRAAQRAGRASPDAAIGDVLAAIAALSARSPDDPERPERLLELLIEGVLVPEG
jgi:AcrR family transcriptional regulator